MRRPTFILLIVFILLGALVWYMQQPGNPVKSILATSTPLQNGAASPSLLISPDKGPISSISIQDATGKSVLIVKKAGQWVVNDGQEKAADQSQAESAAGHVLNLPITKKFDTAPDPAGTGLDKPSDTISVTLADASIFTFTIGKPTVTGSGYYAKAAGGVIYILSKSELDALTLFLTQPPFVITPTAPFSGSTTPAPGTPPPSAVAPSSTP